MPDASLRGTVAAGALFLAAIGAGCVSGCSPGTAADDPAQPISRSVVLDPVLSSEIAFDPTVPIAAAGFQQNPAVASGGGQYLIVWDTSSESGNRDIWGLRVSAAGARLDATGFPIALGVASQYAPAVSFSGTNFLVAWNDERASPAGIYAARVTPAGAVMDPGGLLVASRDGAAGALSIDFDGTNHMIATIVGTQVRVIRVSPAGAPVGALTVVAATGENPVVAWNGGNHLVAYRRTTTATNTFDMLGRLVSAQGVLGASEFVIAASTTAASLGTPQAVASNGDEWLVVFNNAAGVVRGRRVSAAGAPLGPTTGIAYDGLLAAQRLAAVFSGGSYYLFSDGASGLQGARTDGAGVVTAGPTAFTSPYATDPNFPAAAADGTSVFVVFSDSSPFPASDDIFGRRVSAALASLDEPALTLSRTSNRQQDLAAAFNGTQYLVVWSDLRAAQSQVFGARVAQNGTVLEPAGFAITPAGTAAVHPSVASNGTDWLVAWESLGTVRGARVTAAGAISDATGLMVATGTTHRNPAVASNGTDYFVVWTDGAVPIVRGARVRANGTLPEGGTGFLIHKSASSDFPSIAWNGTYYLVASTNGAVVGSRVSAAAVLLDAADIAIGAAAQYPAVASNGADWLVSWWTSNATVSEIRAARVSGAGVLLDGTSRLVTATGLERPAVAYDGAAYWIGWSDWRNVGGRLTDNEQNSDVYVGSMRPDGTRPTPAETAVAQATAFEGLPAIAAGGSSLLAAYTRLDFSAGYGSRRARVRLLQSTRFPDAGAGGAGGADGGRGGAGGNDAGTGGATGAGGSSDGGRGGAGGADAGAGGAGGATGGDGAAGAGDAADAGNIGGGNMGDAADATPSDTATTADATGDRAAVPDTAPGGPDTGADRAQTGGGGGGGGCGCRTDEGPGRPAPALLWLLGVVFLGAGRRRRGRRAAADPERPSSSLRSRAG